MARLILQLIAIVVASIGGIVAILGDTRDKNRLTRMGWASVCLITVGCVTAILLSITEWRASKRALEDAALDAKIARLWAGVEEEPIEAINLTIWFKRPMPVGHVVDLTQQAAIVVRFSETRGSDGVSRLLRLGQRSALPGDLRKCYGLISYDEHGNGLSLGASTMFTYAELPSPSPPLPLMPNLPPQRPEAKRFWEEQSRLSALRELQDAKRDDGRMWYRSAPHFVISEPRELVNGIELRHNWPALELGDRLKTMRDLRRGMTLEIIVPEQLLPKNVAMLSVSLEASPTSAYVWGEKQVFAYAIDDGVFTTTLSGRDLYELAWQSFKEDQVGLARDPHWIEILP